MLENTEQEKLRWPASIIVIGCGLLGTSFALATKAKHSHVEIDGVEVNPKHLSDARDKHVYRRITPELPNAHYDLAVLSVPVSAACDLLPQLSSMADIVMDVCSSKAPICAEAERLTMVHQFAPTHPMAGLASEGPKDASGDLFQDRPWLLIDGWPASSSLVPLLRSIGARVVHLCSAGDHDIAMAAVSHGVHVTSLAAMLAFANAEEETGVRMGHITGPGFRDVTRLSASPPDFWVSTLSGNREHVGAQIRRIIGQLEAFLSAIETGDELELRRLLSAARAAHADWKRQQMDLPSS